jgi:hypothetical protein
MREALWSALKACAIAEPRHPARVWRIDGVSAAVEACRSSVLDAICANADAFVHYDEPPTGYAGLDEVHAVTSRIWHVPKGTPARALRDWLYMGNWQLYAAPAPLTRIEDLCRASDAAVAAFVQASGVGAIIDAFHDDVSWVVAIPAELR